MLTHTLLAAAVSATLLLAVDDHGSEAEDAAEPTVEASFEKMSGGKADRFEMEDGVEAELSEEHVTDGDMSLKLTTDKEGFVNLLKHYEGSSPYIGGGTLSFDIAAGDDYTEHEQGWPLQAYVAVGGNASEFEVIDPVNITPGEEPETVEFELPDYSDDGNDQYYGIFVGINNVGPDGATVFIDNLKFVPADDED